MKIEKSGMSEIWGTESKKREKLTKEEEGGKWREGRVELEIQQ